MVNMIENTYFFLIYPEIYHILESSSFIVEKMFYKSLFNRYKYPDHCGFEKLVIQDLILFQSWTML